MKLGLKIAAASAAFAVPMTLAVAPASAYPVTRHLVHFAPDNGFDVPILVTCDWDASPRMWHAVVEGAALKCNMEGVYTGPYQGIKCYEGPGVGWQMIWDGAKSQGAGAEKSSYAPAYGCVIQKTKYR